MEEGVQTGGMGQNQLVDTRVLCSEETEGNKKTLKIVMFDSQVSLVNTQGLEKKKKEHKNLAWLQRNAMTLRPALIL